MGKELKKMERGGEGDEKRRVGWRFKRRGNRKERDHEYCAVFQVLRQRLMKKNHESRA